jgi:hypothetical protein
MIGVQGVAHPRKRFLRNGRSRCVPCSSASRTREEFTSYLVRLARGFHQFVDDRCQPVSLRIAGTRALLTLFEVHDVRAIVHRASGDLEKWLSTLIDYG